MNKCDLNKNLDAILEKERMEKEKYEQMISQKNLDAVLRNNPHLRYLDVF